MAIQKASLNNTRNRLMVSLDIMFFTSVSDCMAMRLSLVAPASCSLHQSLYVFISMLHGVGLIRSFAVPNNFYTVCLYPAPYCLPILRSWVRGHQLFDTDSVCWPSGVSCVQSNRKL